MDLKMKKRISELKIFTVTFSFFIISILPPQHVMGQSKVVNGYTKQQILYLQFGNGDKEVRVLGNPFCGPGAMAVDKNENIYISEPGNHRIQVFSSNGSLIKSVPTDSAVSSFQINETGDIYTTYLADKFKLKILRIKSNGEKIKYEQKWGPIYEDSLLDETGNKIFSFEDRPSTSSKFNEPLFLKTDVTNTYNRKRGGDWFLHIRTEKINRIAQKNGKATISDSVNIPLENKRSMHLEYKVLGFDDDGNVYLLQGYSRNHYMDLKEEEIRIYSIEGTLISEIPVDIDACYANGLNQHFYLVDKKGNIFQLLTTQTGAYVYKWIKE